ncbi:MAG TPA: ribbon-helix-helix protein, CopG family [Actinomycetales bacterium]|nr:ribbon-helix-helix protein, CopG family [Actinomycetales bacterium]
MRTTVRLEDDLLRAVKKHATGAGRTVTSVIEEALRRELQRVSAAEQPPAYRVDTFRSGVRPGVDLDDSPALLDAMESR